MKKTAYALLLAIVSSLPVACSSGPEVHRTIPLVASADAPYSRVLVVALFESFDARRYLEKEVIAQLAARGVDGVAMTSMTDTRTLINRDTVVDRVQQAAADAVLVMQLVSFEAQGEAKDARPQATYNVRPTYWYNVFSVELTEYVEPQYVEFTNQLSLAADVYSTRSQERVWSIATDWTFKKGLQAGADYSRFVDEAAAIVNAAARDGLLQK
jgi:hypothetical protein